MTDGQAAKVKPVINIADVPLQENGHGDTTMKYLGISTSGDTEVVEYPDSGKFGVLSRFDWSTGSGGVRYVGRVENSLDYWDGE